MNELTFFETLTSKEKKYFKKIQNKAWLVCAFYTILRYEKKGNNERYKT